MNNIIAEHGLVVIVRGVPQDKIANVAEAVYRGGGRVMEVAFNPSDPDTIVRTTGLIRAIRDALGDRMMVGAGTVIRKDYLMAAYHAGAKFMFAPNVNTELIRLAKTLGMIAIPGAFTPSEIMTAYDAGADLVKLFPITVDDLPYLRNITRPLSHVPFLCVGGINSDTIVPFIRAGASGVGTGISILKPELIEAGDYDKIADLTRLHLAKIAEGRAK